MEDIKSLLSIVIPIFNAESYILRSLNSVLEQTYQNFEILIIDDGSTDNSVNIIKKIKDKRIRLHLNHHDFIGSLNMGLSLARGKYIVRMDADDIMHPERLDKQFTFMETYPEVDVCGTWIKRFGIRDEEVYTPQAHHDIACSLLSHNVIVHPSVTIRKKSLEKYNLKYKVDYPHAEDYKLWTDFVMNGGKLANIPSILLDYYCGEGQVTQKYRAEMEATTKKIQIEYMEYVINTLYTANNDIGEFIDKSNHLMSLNEMSQNCHKEIIKLLYKDYLTSNN